MQMKKAEAPLLNIPRARAMFTVHLQTDGRLSDVIAIFARSRLDECSGVDDGLRARAVGGVNEIVDTLGVNEGLEGERPK